MRDRGRVLPSLAVLALAGMAQGWHPVSSPRARALRGPVAAPRLSARVVVMSSGGDGQTDPDRYLNELEDALKHAVDLEQFDEAAKARQRLQDFMLERGDVNGVLNCNRDFYESFSNGNLERMGSVWFNDDHVQCVHAGHKALRGYERIMTAFAAQFRTVRSLAVSAEDVRVTVRGTVAWVLCTQHMRHPPTGSHRALMATNIFRCAGGRWYLVHHHAGYVKGAPALGGALGNAFGGLGDADGNGVSGGIRIIDASSMGGGGTLDDITGLIGRVMDGGSSGAHHLLSASGGDDGLLLSDEETAAEELCRATLQYICTLGREKALTSRQKRHLVTDVIEHDGDETPAYIVRAFKLLCLNKNGELVSDSFARDEFLVQCKLEARRLAASQERPRSSSSSREDMLNGLNGLTDVDDDMLD